MNDDNDNRRAYHDDVDDADYGRVPDSYTSNDKTDKQTNKPIQRQLIMHPTPFQL